MAPRKKTSVAVNSLEKAENPVEKRKLSPEEIAAICAEVADDRKASNIVRLKTGDLTAVAEYLILCTGTSEPHLSAISERIQRELRNNYAVRALHVDGQPQSHWMILDYGSVMVHIMTEELRGLYQLESLWGDAPRVDAIKKITAAAKKVRKPAKGVSEKES